MEMQNGGEPVLADNPTELDLAKSTSQLDVDTSDNLENHCSTASTEISTDGHPTLESTLSNEKLRGMLKTQLEYYFSPENLSQDKYLLTQMDRDQWVPIAIIAGFNQVRRLTHQLDLVMDVLKESPVVEVDEVGQKVRPASKRRTIILRDIPEETKKEDVEALFQGDGCPKFVDCVFAHAGHWYVTFLNEEEAQKALFFLREKGRTFNGEPIKARLKAGLPLAVSTSSYVRPSQNGIVSMPSYDANNTVPAAAAPAAVAITLPPAKCAYTQLPAVQYIHPHPSYPFFPPQIWPNLFFANEQGITAAAFYPSATLPTHITPTFQSPAVGGVGYPGANSRQRTRRSSGSSSSQRGGGGGSVQSGERRHTTSSMGDGPGAVNNSTNQPPRFSRRHAGEQHLSESNDSTIVSPNAESGSPGAMAATQNNTSNSRPFTSSGVTNRERTGVTRAVASAQTNHVMSQNMETSTNTSSLDFHGHGYSGRSPASRRGGGGPYRGRRRPFNDEPNSRVEQRKPENFELEANSFPPLPGNNINVATVGDSSALPADSKTLSDVVKGIGKIPVIVDKPVPAVSTTVQPARPQHHQPLQHSPTAATPASVACESDISAPVCSVVPGAHNRISRSTSTDKLSAVADDLSTTLTVNDNSPTAISVSASTAVNSNPFNSTNEASSAVHNSVEDQKIVNKPKLSYAQIAQRGKEPNELPSPPASNHVVVTVSVSAAVLASAPSSETQSDENAKEASSSSEFGWKTRGGHHHGGSGSYKNSRYATGSGGRGSTFAGGHRPRTFNGVAAVGSSKH